GADGDTDVGLGQRRGIVDTIPDHGHDLIRALQPAYLVRLVARQYLGQHPVDADLLGDRLGGALVVAGDHGDVEAEALERGDRLDTARLDRVGHGDQPGWLAIDRDEHG